MSTVAPIRPIEITDARLISIPDVVFEVFNQLITDNFTGTRATVHQNTVVKELEGRGLNRSEIYRKHWLDVEEFYRQVGWIVTYDKPGYNEDYEAYFVFKKK
jgi:hypothetical protein